jgi:hypothetical protein
MLARRTDPQRKQHAMRARRVRATLVHARIQVLCQEMEADWETLMTPGEDA